MPASPIVELPRPLAIVCHDAGAANIILHSLPGDAQNVRILAQGPSAQIATAIGHPSNVATVDQALDGAATLLSGTGWASDLEHEARDMARREGITSIAVLDHWVNYPQRFIRNGVEVLPDFWWVTDRFAQTEALRHFDSKRIKLVPNLYAIKQLSLVPPVNAMTPNILLYLLEPARSDWGKHVPGEFQALDYFVERLPTLGLPMDTEISLRPHPSDLPEKYDQWIARQQGITFSLDTSSNIAEAIGRSRWVAGCESYGLALALETGRPVYCTLPPHAPRCRLPHDRLIHIQVME